MGSSGVVKALCMLGWAHSKLWAGSGYGSQEGAGVQLVWDCLVTGFPTWFPPGLFKGFWWGSKQQITKQVFKPVSGRVVFKFRNQVEVLAWQGFQLHSFCERLPIRANGDILLNKQICKTRYSTGGSRQVISLRFQQLSTQVPVSEPEFWKYDLLLQSLSCKRTAIFVVEDILGLMLAGDNQSIYRSNILDLIGLEPNRLAPVLLTPQLLANSCWFMFVSRVKRALIRCRCPGAGCNLVCWGFDLRFPFKEFRPSSDYFFFLCVGSPIWRKSQVLKFAAISLTPTLQGSFLVLEEKCRCRTYRDPGCGFCLSSSSFSTAATWASTWLESIHETIRVQWDIGEHVETLLEVYSYSKNCWSFHRAARLEGKGQVGRLWQVYEVLKPINVHEIRAIQKILLLGDKWKCLQRLALSSEYGWTNGCKLCQLRHLLRCAGPNTPLHQRIFLVQTEHWR